MQLQAEGDLTVPHTKNFQSGASTQILTLDGGDLVWCAGADTHIVLSSRLQGSAGVGAARLAEGGGLPTKVCVHDELAQDLVYT